MTAQNRIAYLGIKRQFDPASVADLKEYQHFLTQGRWRHTCPFICEPPWESVVFMIERRIAEVWIGTLITEAAL